MIRLPYTFLRVFARTAAALATLLSTASADHAGWAHSGELAILTTPEGADLPTGSVLEGFPVLVRLDRDWFDFSQTKPGGEDLRFATAAGEPLAFQIEEWDAAKGTASVWVRVPKIEGNARQTVRVFWGKADAANESDGKAVFDESNGYASVWHLGETVRDEVGTLESEDKGTTVTSGIVGKARHFPGSAGVFGGDKIPNYPSGDSAHTTSLWFRAEQPNGTIIGWGNEGGGRGSKVRMQFRSPPHVHIDSDFSDIKGESRLPMHEWVHVAHTFGDGPRRLYINGRMDAEATTLLDIKSPARLWLAGWYHNYDFVGDLDEVRLARVARSADWVRLEYENQKPRQTLVGPMVQAGDAFAVTPAQATVEEGKRVTFSARAGGALKVYWVVKDGAGETIAAVDRFAFTFDAGRVTGDTTTTLQFRAVYPDGVKTKEIPITITEAIPEPGFKRRGISAPGDWDGRSTIEVFPQVTNYEEMKAAGAGDVKIEWKVSPFAVIKEIKGDRLILKRAQNSGRLIVQATVSNGGRPTTVGDVINVTEPEHDAWVARRPEKDEKPVEGQFYARDESGEGMLYYNGTLTGAADSVFLKLYADDKLVKTETAKVGADKSYALSTKLKPGLVKYKVEFGVGGKVLETVGDLVCGDAYLIDGQSNALATDTGEQSPAETNEWIRSYGRPSPNPKDNEGNHWCLPVWKAQNGEKAELGWWGMELAKRLVVSQQVPVFLINAAVGGTRIDQHQRNMEDATDLTTIYGRMLWRVREAKLTHGIRAILWHQGENDQGAAGPDGGYGWETYHDYFIEMAAGWKTDFPNLQHTYVYQIWPNACSMGGSDGSGDRLREKQRTLPLLFSNLSILSTLGVRPPGGCHFPLEGWTEFARLVQPVIERDFYDQVPAAPVTAPNLQRAYFSGIHWDTIALEFDQPVVWEDKLAGQFYLDGEKDKVASGSVAGKVLTLKLREPFIAKTITYLKEVDWNQDTLLLGTNGIAALTFCEVLLERSEPQRP